MGFVLSILYFVTYYLTPPVLFGPLAVVRIELILAALVCLASLPALKKSLILKTPQSLASVGLFVAGFMSVLIGMHWAGGAIQAFSAITPCAIAYFLVCLHCNSKKKLQGIVLVLLFVCLFVIAHGYIDLHRVAGNAALQPGVTESEAQNQWDKEHPYLFVMNNDAGESFYRLRGLGLINDPNDFGQLLVCAIPMMFIFWRPKRVLKNLVFVILPVCALLFGAYLTHSRGTLLALMAVAVVGARRRTGTLPALLIAGVLFVSAMALHFTGGREISAQSGSDRTALWSSGLQMIKTHPLFGVGLGSFADNCEGCGHTAHNSVMVCAAELGMFGLFFWSLFLFPTVRDALATASPKKVNEGELIVSKERHFPSVTRKIEEVDKAEINRLGRLLVMSLTGFLVAGWFLSRSYVMTLFLLGGMAEVVYEMVLQRGMIAPRLSLSRVLLYAGGLAISLVLLMYIMLRITNLMH
jgi:O-Antigen ligase